MKLNGATKPRKPPDDGVNWRAELYFQALQLADLLEEIEEDPDLYDWTALVSIWKQNMDGPVLGASLEEPETRAKIIAMIHERSKSMREVLKRCGLGRLAQRYCNVA